MAAISDLEIRPNVGVGPITFGLTRQELEGLIGPPTLEFRRNEFSTGQTLKYRDWFCFVEVCDENQQVVEIEFYQGAEVTLGGIKLMKVTNQDALLHLLQMDSSSEVDDEGSLISNKLGILIPIEEDGEQTESILLFQSTSSIRKP